jgi:uncharacterized membrane protein
MVYEMIALLCTALFAGAAIYVSAVEHPARMSAGLGVALAQFRPSYRRAAVMQSVLAVAGFAAALAAYAAGRGWPALVGGLFLIFAVPWTLVVIMPTNRQLLDTSRMAEMAGTESLLRKWEKLHAVRAVMSFVGLTILVTHIGMHP